MPYCTALRRPSWRLFSSSRAAKANCRTLCSPFLLQSDSNGVGQLALGPCLVFVCFVSTGSCRWSAVGVCSTLRRCDCVVATFFFFRFVLQSIYVLAGTRRKESQSQPQTFDSPFSISLRYRILLSTSTPIRLSCINTQHGTGRKGTTALSFCSLFHSFLHPPCSHKAVAHFNI